ncbi:hypothetical protein PPYR_00901 [Photinus pyralis]|uniref:Alpha-mannosidase n=1 Tax=Photinus pyralis TaxID=7054 RepID=A0A5N4B2U1_PHOPY|nr:alpha-mannosidase 2 [Photinus pyralis]KAB0803931.1 hypothetical protein PPYR_00901 [Photinus pyralis]
MRVRRAIALVGVFLIFLACFMIYVAMDMTVFPNRRTSIHEEYQENKWLHFEDRLKQLESDLNKHHEEVGEIKEAIKVLVPATNTTPKLVKKDGFKVEHLVSKIPSSEIIFDATCPFQVNTNPKTDIQMLELYKKLSFDNPDGGVWKQGWNIEINPSDWNKQHKLKVFVVPHSHNDPGWIKTVDEYYLSQTKHILNNMITKLTGDLRRKFIWAEISYFSMWWDDLELADRENVKKLIHNNQLEIVTGGWVMNDEANSHWISILHQITEGHQWLERNLNYTPKSHWSIDPFGMSATQPFLLKEMGLQNMLIQRVHYSVKKQLARDTNLEFRWKQVWDNLGTTEIFTQLMPFYSYDVPHTCGPDPKICCQFDFKRLPGHGLHCPWKIAPQQITDNNVAQKAELLLDQYRKKSMLYKSNVLLIPLGDDFRFSHLTEWDVQYENYQKLFDHMNSNPKMFVQIQFGTLTDYFNAVHAEKGYDHFPSLSGDFFTYADRGDHYWSGYFTSRPFYKRMDRVLLSYIRAAEIILTLAHLSEQPSSNGIASEQGGFGKIMSNARRELALFQHHDGITGTAKDYVVVDYGTRMLKAIQDCQKILQHSTNFLLTGSRSDITKNDVIHYNVDDVRHSHDKLSERHTITIGPELSIKKLVIFNPLPYARREIVSFLVSTPFLEVLNFKGKKIKCQISPVFEYGSMSNSKYKLFFIANIPAFALVSYTINAIMEHEVPKETVHSTIKIFNQYAEVKSPTGFPKIQVSPSASEFVLQNARISAAFSSLGLLKAIKVATVTTPVHLDFVKYGARYGEERSGAYLFLPDRDASPIAIENTVVKVVEGPLVSFVSVQLPNVHHTTTLYNTPGADGLGLEIQNLVDIERTSNFEIAMRLSTNINSTNEYFTDLNGYQILRRIRFSKLPLQANYYPMPAMAYIEDKNVRLTVVTGTPLGCGSLREGQIEVMMDRKLNQDDHLGLGQGVTDNHPTEHIFRIILEKKTHKCETTADNHPSGFPSLSAHVASQSLLNPLIRMLKNDEDETDPTPAYLPVTHDFGVDFTVPSLRTGIEVNGKEYVGVIVQRQHLDVCFSDRVLLQQFPLSHGTVNLKSLLPPLPEGVALHKSLLSFLNIGSKILLNSDIEMCPMDIQAYVLDR